MRNICSKNYRNMLIGFYVTVKNVGDAFFGIQCSVLSKCTYLDCLYLLRIQLLVVFMVLVSSESTFMESE